MRLPAATVSFALVLALTGLLASAEPPPNLAGTWMFATQRDFIPTVGPRANFGTEFEIRQDASSITIARGSGSTASTAVHPFDGRETTSQQGQSVVKGRARWQGDRFVIDVTSVSPPGADGTSVTTVSTRRLWRESDALISEWVITAPSRSTSISVYRQPPTSPAAFQPAKATLASIAWLVGAWERRQGTSLLEERWTQAAGGAMLGLSRTVSGDRMVEFEFLRIVERAGTLEYLAQPNGRAPATPFTLTQIGANEAVFENPGHDYPKMIRYTLAPDGTLTAVIADVAGLKPQYYVFKKAGS